MMTLTFVGMIVLAGSASFAQYPDGDESFPGQTTSNIPSMTTDGSMGLSITEMMQAGTQPPGGIPAESPNDPSIAPLTPTESIIELPAESTAAVPEVNLETAESLDTLGRYPPKLKINFTEFPLRSLSLPQRAEKEPQEASPDAKVLFAVLSRVRNRLHLPHVNLVVEDRVAVVSGTVTTERERSLTELMLCFEPGIDSVQNRLTVAPAE